MSRNISQANLMTTLRTVLQPLAFGVVVLMVCQAAIVPVANAQVTTSIIADPGAPRTQQPTILNTANGVTQVNIQTPNASGVSRNTYRQFDVGSSGAILNNSRTNVQTQQGGWVAGNPWLATGSARVILNEVNSSNPSYLNGYVEVAGPRAEVIIANPSGINISGGGFINTSRALLTTGVPNFNSAGGIDSYTVRQGQIIVNGQGLDASGTDYTDLISRSVQLNAGVWANNLRVTTGANQVDAGNTTATPIAGTGVAPSFAIDSTALGGMYANAITLVGTENGVGVRNAGQIGASAGGLTVTVDGLLINSGRVTASGDISANTTQGINNTGLMYAGGNAALTTQGSIANDASGGGGVIAAQGNATLIANGPASQINSTSGSVIAAGLQADGTLVSSGDLSLSATAGVTGGGQLLAGGNFGLSGSSLNLSGAQISAGGLNLTATAGDLDATGAQLVARDTINANAGQTLRTDSAILYANQLNLAAHDISNVGGQLIQTGTGDLTLAIPGAINNTQGLIAGNGNTTITGQTLNNQGGAIQAVGTSATPANLSITTIGNLDNSAGSILAGNNATVQVAQLINTSGTLAAAQDLGVTATGLAGNGKLLAGRDATFNLQGDYINATGNQIAANRNLTLNTTGTFTNSATLQAGNDLNIAAKNIVNDNADQSSSLLAGGRISTYSDTFINTSTVIGGELSINAGQSIVNSGPKALLGATNTAGTLELLAPIIQNRDDVTATDTAPQTTILGLGNVVLAGGKDSSGNYTPATQVLNQSGLIQSGGDMLVHADTLTNTRRILTANAIYGYVSSNSGTVVWTPENPDVPGGRYIEPPHGGEWNSGYLYTNYTQNIYRNSIDQISPEARILAGGNFTPVVSSLQNYWSKINAQGDISLNGVTLDQDSWRGTQTLQELTTGSGTYLYRNYKGRLWTNPWGTTYEYKPVTTYESSFTANGAIGGSGNTINNPVGGSPANLPGITAPGGATGVTLTLPTGGLYHINSSPNANYLVESNPAFADQFKWRGSDAYLSQLGYDPNKVLKRLGDNYYEQQLVRDQVLALTGKAVSDGYANAQAQFEQMYAEGASVAKGLQLQPGLGLTAEQVAALTSNLILLEEREVDTPTGRQNVLVPVVYLAHINSGDLLANGPMIAGSDISLSNTRGFNNQGSIIAKNSLGIDMAQGATLNNRGGSLQAGGAMQLRTVDSNIDLTSAGVKAAQLSIASGKDLILSTEARTTTTSEALGIVS